MSLPNDVVVYPAHGAGSACGKNMSKETTDTLGHQKMVNYVLRADMTKDEFIAEVTSGLLSPPNYFPQNVMMNKDGYESIDIVMRRVACPLSPDAFDAAANETDALILDVRASRVFSKGFIPNAINIGLDGQFAPWVGAEYRSMMALSILKARGYTNLVDVAGGYAAIQKTGRIATTNYVYPTTRRIS